MSKKKKAGKSFNGKNSSNNEELDSLFKNLGKPEQSESNEDVMKKHEGESELEKDVDDSNLSLQNLEFHQFMHLQNSKETGAHVLERIAGSQARPIFVGGIPREATSLGRADSKNESGYVPGTAENGEKKYFSDSRVENAPERLDFERIGRTDSFREEINQERFFRQSESRIESQSPERFEKVERFDAEKVGRRNPFERPEEKYEKYRPKLPKS